MDVAILLTLSGLLVYKYAMKPAQTALSNDMKLQFH